MPQETPTITYDTLWDSMIITAPNTVNAAAKKALLYKPRYDIVAAKTGVDWLVIACIHYREASFDFTTHLHNGDPLSARTVHVPAGRPISGNPPFTWEQSAIDALQYDGADKVHTWNLNNTLYYLEKFNGFGYRKYHGINSPYLWSGTNHYTTGKYEQDGKYNADLVDKQIGCAPLLATLETMAQGWM